MTSNGGKGPGLWSHDVPNQSPALIIISTLFLLVTTLFFGLRVKERWKRRPHGSDGLDSLATKMRKICLSDDAMAAAAYTTLVIQTVFGGMAAHYGFGKHRANIPSTFPKAMFYFFLYQICYKLLGGFTKLTFCFLYLAVFTYTHPEDWYQRHFRSIVVTTAVVIGAGTFVFTVATVFQCTPVERAWDRRVHGHCTNNLAFWFSHAAFNTFMDIIVFILPIPVIGGIAAARKIRVGLMSTFALGAFVIAASIARMVHLRGSAASTADPTWGSMPALIWTEVEANTAVIVCCCPALPALVKQFWRKTRRIFGQTVSLDSGSPKGPSHQGSASRPTSPPPTPSSRFSWARSLTLDRLAAFWRTIITRKSKPPDNDINTSPYTQGYLTYVVANKDAKPRWNCFRSRKWKSPENTSWTTGDHELGEMEPVSYLSPRIRYGGLFKKNSEEVPGPIYRTRDVTVTSHRRSQLEQTDSEFERDEFARQNTERETPRLPSERKFDRRAAGIS